jgi:hypothetical protein
MFKDFRGGRRLDAGEARNLVRAMSSRFIQTGRWAKIAKKFSMTHASGGAAVSGTKIRAFDQSLA